jgi:hypothetical protein
VFGPGFDMTGSGKGLLDGAPAGVATVVYPLDHALFPPNFSPVYVHIQSPGATIARLSFQGPGVALSFYGNCESGLPGGGCYVGLPSSLTQLLVAPSEQGDIALTARAYGAGSGLREAPAINVAWADLPLSGGLYYWSIIPSPPRGYTATPPNYILLDPTQTNGTGVFRYSFGSDGSALAPAVVWTDDGGPASSPPYNGAPQAYVAGLAGGHCIGCHAVTNDGKYMALTLGGSDATTNANFALLDIVAQTLININPSASVDPQSTATNDPIDYWKKFRMEGLATENAWGPNGDILISMFKSKLYRTNVAVTGTTGTATRVGPVFSTSNAEYQTDPCWSRDGSLFVFTSFDMPDTGLYNTSGLNGDMRRRGKICIASASAAGVNDDATDLVARVDNVTSYAPNLSGDGKLVVFNQSSCGTDPDVNKTATDYGNQTCDGYDDSSATLSVVSATGGAATLLARANGGGAFSNSWPRFGPSQGSFRGQTLYWIAFTSRRPYGLVLNSGVAAAKPQLWLAGITAGGAGTGDPSFAPVWLPGQDASLTAPTNNHTPQWVPLALPLP